MITLLDIISPYSESTPPHWIYIKISQTKISEKFIIHQCIRNKELIV